MAIGRTGRAPYLSLLLIVALSAASCGGRSKLTKHPFADPGTESAWNIHSAIEDRKGNLWFATTGEGVYRYHDKTFDVFTTSNGLSSNTLWSMIEDRDGRIWFGTNDGASYFDGVSITRFPISSAQGGEKETIPGTTNEVWSMLQDNVGRIWFGTTEGVFIYDKGEVRPFLASPYVKNPYGLRLKRVQCMLQLTSGDIVFGSGLGETEGVCRFDGTTLSQFKPNRAGWIRTILEDKGGDLYFATRHEGVCRYDGSIVENISKRAGINDHDITTIFRDSKRNLWIGVDQDNTRRENAGGLWRYDGSTFRRFTTKDGLPDNSVWTILEDKSGSIWVGTRNVGLARFEGTGFTRFSE